MPTVNDNSNATGGLIIHPFGTGLPDEYIQAADTAISYFEGDSTMT